jgi:hypothetical protein
VLESCMLGGGMVDAYGREVAGFVLCITWCGAN